MIDTIKKRECQEGSGVGMFFDLVRQLKSEDGKVYVERKLHVKPEIQH